MPRTAKSSDFKVPDNQYARTIPCNHIATFAPLGWLKKGATDLIHAPMVSLFYGLCFALAAAGIEWVVFLQGSHLVVFPSLIVYMLIGPFLALGLYDASWQMEKNNPPKLLHSMFAIRRNSVSQWSFAVMLCVAMIFWMRIASLLHAIYPEMQGAPLSHFMPFLVTGSVVGIIFSCLIFSISAFSIPLMMERRVDVMTAVFTSFNAVKHNLSAMMVWAALIVVGLLIGFATAGIGMLITMPILGFATWHGYRATIQRKH
ncbi:DUF2189 domain-containing protein [Vibrio sp. S11_S32]|uniref:DUF2189 domain-containing protein n=1 Tax=Vibrio sp. S11_S32 TaxID=2720225 RepID=UPI0016801D30|nr:DUF2189 domain-containing protein [Vibrio sp. S11_S32]MBD1576248.1 DUF2189 domain-containing protein [Vibrio sp. S11_S32]